MQIVIDISEDRYARVCNHTEQRDDMLSILVAIENGTSLPKGNGKLIFNPSDDYVLSRNLPSQQ